MFRDTSIPVTDVVKDWDWNNEPSPAHREIGEGKIIESLVGVSTVNHWNVSKKEKVESVLSESGFRVIFCCGVRHPILIMHTILKKRIYRMVDWRDNSIDLHLNSASDKDVIDVFEQHEDTLFNLDAMYRHFEYMSMSPDMIKIPVDTLYNMEREERFHQSTK